MVTIRPAPAGRTRSSLSSVVASWIVAPLKTVLEQPKQGVRLCVSRRVRGIHLPGVLGVPEGLQLGQPLERFRYVSRGGIRIGQRVA